MHINVIRDTFTLIETQMKTQNVSLKCNQLCHRTLKSMKNMLNFKLIFTF